MLMLGLGLETKFLGLGLECSGGLDMVTTDQRTKIEYCEETEQ